MMLSLAVAPGVAGLAQETDGGAEAGRWTPGLSAGVDVANAYVFRGLTYNDGLVIQPWITLSGLPVEFTVWANYDVEDYNGNLKKDEVSEIDYSASCPFSLGPVDAVVGYAFWTYPNSSIQDDQVATLDLSHAFFEALQLGVSWDYSTVGPYKETWYFKPYVNYTHGLTDDLALDLSGKVGYVDYHETELGNGWAHYDLGAKLSYRMLCAGVTYTGRIDEDVLPSGVFGYDVRWLWTAGVAIDF